MVDQKWTEQGREIKLIAIKMFKILIKNIQKKYDICAYRSLTATCSMSRSNFKVSISFIKFWISNIAIFNMFVICLKTFLKKSDLIE